MGLFISMLMLGAVMGRLACLLIMHFYEYNGLQYPEGDDAMWATPGREPPTLDFDFPDHS